MGGADWLIAIIVMRGFWLPSTDANCSARFTVSEFITFAP